MGENKNKKMGDRRSGVWWERKQHDPVLTNISQALFDFLRLNQSTKVSRSYELCIGLWLYGGTVNGRPGSRDPRGWPRG